MNKEVSNEFENMTLEEMRSEVIKTIRELPEEAPLEELYEGIKEIMRNESTK